MPNSEPVCRGDCARLADYIRRTVDAAPELTAEQRVKLTELLTGGAQC